MDFSDALQNLKLGFRVRRKGWNGKNMWIALTPGSEIPCEAARAGAASHRAGEILEFQVLNETVDKIKILPHIDMKAADGSLVIGWLASQTDLLADDWEIMG